MNSKCVEQIAEKNTEIIGLLQAISIVSRRLADNLDLLSKINESEVQTDACNN